MKRYSTLILTVLILASGIMVGCGQETSPSASKIYTSKTYGYSFQYPGDWFVDVGDELNLRIGNSKREAYVTMVITPVPATGSATTEEILKLYVDNAKSSGEVYYEQYRLTDEKVLQRAYPAYQLIYTHRGKGKHFVWQTRNLIAYWKGKIYDFGCSVQEDKYYQYSSTLDTIYNSLTLQE